MYKYSYIAKNKVGDTVQNSIWAESVEEVKVRLRNNRLYIISIEKEAHRKNAFLRRPTWTLSNIISFSFEMGTLLEAGVSIRSTIALLVKEHRGNIPLDVIQEGIERGGAIHALLGESGFPLLGCALLEAGAQTGRLGLSFLQVQEHYEREKLRNEKLLQMMLYPAFILVLMIGFFIGAVFFILPSFKGIFDSLGADLPLITRLLFWMGDVMREHTWLCLGVAVAFCALVVVISKQKRVQGSIQSRLWKWGRERPWYGGVRFARVFRVLSVLLSAGISLPTGLALTADLWSNEKAKEGNVKTIALLQEGRSLSAALRENCMGTNLIYELIVAGEAAGELDRMLLQCAEYYDKEVIRGIKQIEKFIEPALMSIMGLGVGTLVLAVMIPLFDAVQSIGNL